MAVVFPQTKQSPELMEDVEIWAFSDGLGLDGLVFDSLDEPTVRELLQRSRIWHSVFKKSKV